MIGAEAMLRLFTEQEANENAFTALTRFLDRLDVIPPRVPARPALDPLVLSFQLKLLWLSGYMPHLEAASSAGRTRGSSASPRPRAARCALTAAAARSRSRRTGCAGSRRCVATPMSDAHDAGLTDRGAREALALVTASYEHHGGFRLRTLSA